MEKLKHAVRAPQRWSFENDVAGYMQMHRVNAAEAVQEMFERVLTDTSDPKHLKKLEGAVGSLFDVGGLKHFKQESGNAAYRGVPKYTPSLRDIRAAEAYFTSRFDIVPPRGVLLDRAKLEHHVNLVSQRLMSDSRLRGQDLNAIYSSPDLAADLGRLLHAHEELSRQDRIIEKGIKAKESREKIKQAGRKLRYDATIGTILNFGSRLRSSFDAGLSGHFGVAGYRFVGAFVGIAKDEAAAIAKFGGKAAWQGVRATARSFGNMIRKYV